MSCLRRLRRGEPFWVGTRPFAYPAKGKDFYNNRKLAEIIFGVKLQTTEQLEARLLNMPDKLKMPEDSEAGTRLMR